MSHPYGPSSGLENSLFIQERSRFHDSVHLRHDARRVGFLHGCARCDEGPFNIERDFRSQQASLALAKNIKELFH